MSHPRIEQLRFARSEWVRGLEGLSEEDAVRRLEPMNSISWMVGHLAWHERLVWLERGLDLRGLEPVLDPVANGLPASTPPLAPMWAAWHRIIERVDPFLETLSTSALLQPLAFDERSPSPLAGSQVLRTTYHYWSHIGEASAIRQLLGRGEVPQFVGPLEILAPYRPEPA